MYLRIYVYRDVQMMVCKNVFTFVHLYVLTYGRPFVRPSVRLCAGLYICRGMQ